MSVGVYYNKHNDIFQSNPYKRESIQKVKRILFGPVDHEETQLFITQELEKHYTLQSERWNFDFKQERPISPSGVYDWRPATPMKQNKPMKRRPSSEIVFDTNDLYPLPENICRPKPVKATTIIADEEACSNKNIRVSQSLITDFMPLKKNTSIEASKKVAGRPTKIPRLGQLKS